jgi:hypothetical protein
MPCDRKLKPRQTPQERATEIRAAVDKLAQRLASRIVRAKVGPQGAIAFEGWDDAERNNVSDACAYRRLLVNGSALALAEIARAEQMAGRSVNKQAVAVGVHSHDNGVTWHNHKG